MLPILFLHLLSAGPSPDSPPLVFPLNEELPILRSVVKTNKEMYSPQKKITSRPGLILHCLILTVVQVLINNKGLNDL